jgi:hypothetical protein
MMTAILLFRGYSESSVTFRPSAQHMKNRDTAVYMLHTYYYNTIFSPNEYYSSYLYNLHVF